MTDTNGLIQKISEICSARLAQETSRLVGHGKQYSVAEIATQVGCSVEAIYRLQQGQAWPGFALCIRIIAALGPEAGDRILSPAIMELKKAQGDTPTPGKIQALTASLVAMYADFMSDGVLSHQELAQLEKAYDQIGTLLKRYSCIRVKKDAAAA